MDKQYKLTDRVSKDSIKSPIFKKWVKRILCIVCILSLSLQLTLCCMPMMSYAAQDDSIVGTWVINSSYTPSDTNVVLNFDEPVGTFYGKVNPNKKDSTLGVYDITHITLNNSYFAVGNGSYGTSGARQNVYWSPYKAWYWKGSSGYDTDISNSIEGRTISFTVDIDNDVLKLWLKSNATKQVTTVYDFTGETRIFNDELTLFNTTDATWTEAFSFNFEVLGVGTADYITLQRTVQNNYTMSYSFDFEDSGGLTMIYRDSPPFDNEEAEWLGGKVNRKVITFISNPEDPIFQQWLLDNTTLFDNVKDAYQLGQQSGYNNGYEEGFANSLIGDTLSGPINALSQITLIEIQGTAITLGGVVMTAIALCLVLAFLKLYAGG